MVPLGTRKNYKNKSLRENEILFLLCICLFSDQGIQYVYTPAAIDLPLVNSRDTRVIQVACGRAHSLILTDKEGGKCANYDEVEA